MTIKQNIIIHLRQIDDKIGVKFITGNKSSPEEIVEQGYFKFYASLSFGFIDYIKMLFHKGKTI